MILGIIPDGNRRWAKQHPSDDKYGHHKCVDVLTEIIPEALKRCDFVYVYMLAPDNPDRDAEENLDLYPEILRLNEYYKNVPNLYIQIGAPPNKDLPKMDLIIRTGGDKRLSGFMPEQSKNAELIVLDKYWPDFTTEDLDAALRRYNV